VVWLISYGKRKHNRFSLQLDHLNTERTRSLIKLSKKSKHCAHPAYPRNGRTYIKVNPPVTPCCLVCLMFIYGSFYGSVSSSEYVTFHNRMINVKDTGKDVKSSSDIQVKKLHHYLPGQTDDTRNVRTASL
jgi:hypothetical protein